MNPDQLLTFGAVARTLNISRAAAHMHLSQPAVSGQLRALQAWFGEPLYHREGQGIRLTPAGVELAGLAEGLRRQCEQVVGLRDARRGLSTGQLRLGGSTTPASYLLPACVAHFKQLHPGIVVSIVSGNTREIVELLPVLDLAFIEGAVPPDLPLDTGVHAWGEDEVVAIVPRDHPLAGCGRIYMDQIAGSGLVMREPGSGVRALVERQFRASGHEPIVALELAGVEGVKHAVRAGLGAGFVSALSMQHEDGGLAMLHFDEPGWVRTLSVLITHASAPTRATQRFMECCRPPLSRQATKLVGL